MKGDKRMPTIGDRLYFNYDGISCRDYKLMNVSLNSGLFEDSLHPSRDITETEIRGSDTPLFSGLKESPIQFSLTIAFTEKYTDDDIDNIIVWLFQDLYKPFYFEDKPDRIYYAMPIGDPKIAHNGMQEGYFTITMRCKSSRLYSPQQVTPQYDLSANSGTYNVAINNTGHVNIYPEISLYKVGDGSITFTKDGQIFEVNNLKNGENIYINCEKEIIETDAVGIYHYEDVVGDFYDLMLNRGNNTISIQGKCKITFRYTMKYKF
jgi:phage-related protein